MGTGAAPGQLSLLGACLDKRGLAVARNHRCAAVKLGRGARLLVNAVRIYSGCLRSVASRADAIFSRADSNFDVLLASADS